MRPVMKKIIALLLLVNVSAYAAETKDYQLYDEQLNISLHTDLKKQSKSTIKKRYAKQSVPPNYAFSNKDNNVTFTFTQYPTPAEKASMNKIHKAISNMLRKANDDASWKKDKVYTRLGTKIVVYEYETKGIGKYQYNITYALPIDGKLTFLSFVTTEKKYKKKWVGFARESLDSIELTKR